MYLSIKKLRCTDKIFFT